MSPKQIATIIGMGAYLPEQILTNEQLEKLVDTSDEWIVSRTGIKERRIASYDEQTSDLGAMAAKRAIEDAHLTPLDIDLILVATMTPDFICPSTASLIQAKIGASRSAVVDLGAACSGFIYGLSMGKAYIESGMYRHILLVAPEKMSSFIDYEDRNTCVLFGDGAAAVVISNEGSGYTIDTVVLGADGELSRLIMIPAGGSKQKVTQETIEQRQHYLKVEGKEVFKHAVRRMAQTTEQCLAQAGIKQEQVSWLIPHQANLRIIDAIAKQLGIPEGKVYTTVQKYGNTSASSVGIALKELTEEKQQIAGSHLLLVAFGGGLTWGSALLTVT